MDSYRPSRTVWQRFVHLLHLEATGGVILLLCTLAALIVANSPWAAAFQAFWQTRLTVGVGEWTLNKPLLLWINDGLMTVFFFIIGLEIKRELVWGELRDMKKAALPVMAALGGMVVPAGIYWLLQRGTDAEAGWGIPMATDIAFVVGFLGLLGPRVPPGLKILLLSLAIADDIGAVLVIAFFYSSDISVTALGLAGLGIGLTVFLRWAGVRRVGVYLLVGAAIWLAVLKSGVHPTVAGVLLGLLTPALPLVSKRALAERLEKSLARLRNLHDSPADKDEQAEIEQMQNAAYEALAPLDRLERRLHPWIGFVIMPLFALANAGVAIEPAAFGETVAWSVALGLALGKPLGIVLFSWIAVVSGLGKLPARVDWKVMIGAGCLAGIGFTMSLFVAGLALTGALLEAGKFGTLVGSSASAVVGLLLLYWFLPLLHPERTERDHQPASTSGGPHVDNGILA